MGGIRDFLTRYGWVRSIIASVVALLLGTGAIWQYFDFRLKSRTVTIEQLRAEKELYERLQLLQHEASEAILQYIPLRDLHLSKAGAKDYQVQNAFNAQKAKLRSLVREYNRLEAKLSTLESRSPRFFVLPLPPMAPKNLRVEVTKDGKARLKWDLPEPDPLVIEVKRDLRDLFHQYGQGGSR